MFTTAKLWNQSRYPTTDEWINKLWYKHTIEYDLAIKKDRVISFSEKWIELEIIMLGEISQAQKAKYCIFSLICRT
jgi:hypothetical protein